MNSECREIEVLRSAAVAGDLPAGDAARLEAHLAKCPSCRQAADRDRLLLDAIRLPPPGPAETLVLAELPARTLAALQRRERHRQVFRRSLAGAAAAAMIVGALLVPAWLRTRAPTVTPAEVAQVQAVAPAVVQASWQEPDLDTLWSESAVMDFSGASSDSEATVTDAALAAYDAGWGT